MRRSKVALLVWLSLPVLIVAGLVWIALDAGLLGERERLARDNPPVGAGAGDTGGVNAIGEMLAGNAANHGVPEEKRPEPPSPPPVEITQTTKPPAPTPTPQVAPTSVAGVRTLDVPGPGGTETRTLRVWVPPSYDDRVNATVAYPVLYLFDGQNVFDKPETAPGEWRADETASDLIGKHAMRPIIIVGVPHGGVSRVLEYLPARAIEGVTPGADDTVAWMLGTVLPAVNGAFRIAAGPENTGIGGSSLGAAAALHAARTHPDRFGIVLAESLPLRTGDASAWDSWLETPGTWPNRVYLGVGGAEYGPAEAARNAELVAAVRSLDGRLKRAGLGPDRRLCIIEPSAEHNEAAWANRFPQALTFLFPNAVDPTK